MIIGLDFGTTNTGAGVFDGERVRLLPIDQAGTAPEVCRSAIYITRAGEYSLGSSAINQYFGQNIGRPTRYRKVRVGEIMQVFAELPVFYRDVYVYEDEFSPGRLFTSIKTALRSREYHGTVFRNTWYSASDLVAIYLGGTKIQIERALGEPASTIVLGRPVHFSIDSTEDQIAQGRLLDAAFKAGFEKVYLEYEPVAAALSYSRGLKQTELILVFDFGGGTLDFTIMEAGGGQQHVLATGGVPIAGDVFDQRLFRASIPKHLGEGDEFFSGKTRLPIPAHIFDTLAQPHEILSLNTPQNLEMLRKVHAGSYHKEKTQALLKVVSSNYALMMFDHIERAKRQLSDKLESDLEIDTPDFRIRERIKRSTFERAITREHEMIRAEMMKTIEQSGVKPAAIDRVVRTGGSSEIPLFIGMLEEIFGPGKVRAIDIFTSVTAGLAMRGGQIAAGFDLLPAYTPETVKRWQETATGQGSEGTSRPVELDTIFKRLQILENARSDSAQTPDELVFVLNDKGIFAFPYQELAGRPGGPEQLQVPGDALKPGCQVMLVEAGQQLLIATSQFKLIVADVRELFYSQQADHDGIVKSLPLESDETATAMMVWNSQEPAKEYVCLLTAAGQGRAFSAGNLSEAIARRPFFQLERRYNGNPAALLSADSQSIIFAGTTAGRAAAAPATSLAVQAFDVIRLGPGERISAASAVPVGARAHAVDEHGAWVEVNLKTLLVPRPPAQRGQLVFRGQKRGVIGIVPESSSGNPTYGFSNLGRRIELLDTGETNTGDSKPRRKSTRLEADEKLIGLIR